MIPICLLCSDPSEFTVAAYFAAGASRLVNKNNPDDLGKLAGPFGSLFYVDRPADAKFAAAVARRESIVLVKGPRQVGKTSLLAGGLQQARQAGARVVYSDFAVIDAAHLESAETLLRALAQAFADQLGLEVSPAEIWESHRGAGANLEHYLQCEVLDNLSPPVVWGMDEVDRLFSLDYAGEIFGLFRSWHNERSLDAASPWSRLTLAMAYATEAHLFVPALNQSPFNVGTALTLADFALEQVEDLNRRYGSPLKSGADLARFYGLVGGQPYLVRRGLSEMATHGTGIAALEAQAASDTGIFGAHLKRLHALIDLDPELSAAVRDMLQGEPCPTSRSFYRLRSAGLAAGTSEKDARLRCPLYAEYLSRQLL